MVFACISSSRPKWEISIECALANFCIQIVFFYHKKKLSTFNISETDEDWGLV